MSGPQLSLFPEAAHAPTLRDVAEAVRAAGIDGLPDAIKRADQARYQEVHVKSALAEAKGMPFRWTLNPYRGCTHACEYCYARKYQRHLELDAGDTFSTLIFVKQNLPDALRRELGRPSWTRESVAIGTATDPYQPIEGHYRLTRSCLDVLIDAETPFSITTKGPMVVRDIDLLLRASARAGARVNMSIPSMDEGAWAKLEPGTAPPAQRLRARPPPGWHVGCWTSGHGDPCEPDQATQRGLDRPAPRRGVDRDHGGLHHGARRPDDAVSRPRPARGARARSATSRGST